MTIALDANSGISVANASDAANLSSTVLTIGSSTVNSTVIALNSSSLAKTEAMAHLNIIVNGEMRISQEKGNTALVTTGLYPADQWVYSYGGTMTASYYNSADAPPGYSNSIIYTVTGTEGSMGAADYAGFYQRIEGYRIARLGWGTANAVEATVGFWAKCSVAGTYGWSINSSGGDRAFVGSIVIASPNTWTWVTANIPATTTGTWAASSAQGAAFWITMASGSNTTIAPDGGSGGLMPTGKSNLVATNGATFQWTGVILLAGNHTISSTQARLIQRHWDDELRLCQRYYSKSYDSSVTPGTVNSNGISQFLMGAVTSGSYTACIMPKFPVSMRTNPTVTMYSPVTGTSGKSRDAQNNADVNATAGNIGTDSFVCSVSMSGASTVINLIAHYAANARM